METFARLQNVTFKAMTIYAKGVTLSKAAMKPIEARLERNPSLPKWDILIRPADG
jgi:hypothetical protein